MKNSSVRSKKDSGDKKGQRLIEKEAMETGRVRNSNYMQFCYCMFCYSTNFVQMIFDPNTR